jgi:hypothetical protein
LCLAIEETVKHERSHELIKEEDENKICEKNTKLHSTLPYLALPVAWLLKEVEEEEEEEEDKDKEEDVCVDLEKVILSIDFVLSD